MELVKDTLTQEAEANNPADPQKTGSGHPQALGGGQAPVQSAAEMTHGQETYPGPRPGGELAKETGSISGNPAAGDASGLAGASQNGQAGTNQPGYTPPAGDVTTGDTQSADETGQAGDTSQPDKNKAHPWNG